MVQEKPFNRYSYTFNHDTGEVETPDVFLLDKKLHKLGRLYPVIDLNIIVKVVDADEISFTFYKYFNDEEQELYSSLINYSVAFVQGFGCFELKVTETDNENGVAKAVSGQSLAYCELSQITATVEINTDDDIIREDKNDYIKDFPTVFYRPYDDESLLKDESYWNDYPGLTDSDKKKILKESSMLHRILSYAPHYRIGHVDKSLYFVQRQFSFDSDINSCLQEISKEVGCIFTYNTYLDDDNQPVREINAYETCYCTKCYQEVVERTGNFKTFTTGKYRSISNGICNTCGSSEFIYDYGDDTDIFLTTENLTDEIQVQPENEVKNCFKVSGGDDLITSTVQALQMSSSNRIVMFSDEQKEQMSEELRTAIEQYDTEYNDNQDLFEDIVKTEYNVIDLIQYLQSSKMPLLAEDVKSIQEEVKYVLDSIISDYECNFYVSSYSGKTETSYVNHAYTSASNAIKNLCTLYIDKGYSVKVSNGDNMVTSKKDGETYIKWNGIISIYETDDRENNYANIHVLKDGETYTDPDGVTYTGTYVEYGAISKPNSNTNLIEKYYNFIVKLGFGDTDSKAFMSYIEQFCNAKLASYKDVEYKNREEKDWKLYSYERLRSYYDAYEECLNALVQIRDTSTENEKTIVNEMYDSYASIQSNIEKQMLILRNQLNALYQFYGVYPNVDDSNAKDYIKKNYSYDLSALGITNATDEAFIAILKDMADNGSKNYIDNKPFACQTCGSSNVGVAERKDINGNVIGTYNYCKSCKETDQSKITTYGDVARQIVEFISQHGSRKYVNNYYLDNLGENVYGSYLSPSIPSYQFSLKDPSNNSGYVLSSYGQNVEPYIVLKTRRNTQSNKRYIVNHSSGTCYIIENNGDVLDVEVRYHSGGKLINSYTILEGGITRIQTSNDNEMTDEYEVTIDIKQRHGGYINCTIFKCFDPRGDLISYTSISDIVANSINYRGLYVWCSYETYNRIDVLFEANSIDSISAERNRLSEYFSLERYLGDDLYKELMLYIREDKYENSNYTSDGCLTNAQLVDKAQELLTKAKQELAKACRQQYSISSPVYSIVATKYRNWSDNNIRMKIYDEFESFKLGNWIRARLDNANYHGHGKDSSRYKMRLMSIQFDFENIDKTNVTYSNVEQNTTDLISKIQDTIASASSMATTYDYVATQAEQGEVAKQKIDNILQNGFDSALSAIKAGENQDITMDRHGLLFRQYLPEKDDYSQYQMKMINRNIVMTSNYWKTASLAIGLGLLPDGTMGYGIWADNIIGGKLYINDNLTLVNAKGTVIIDGDGIRLSKNSIPKDNIIGLDETLNTFVSKTVYNQKVSDLQKQIDGNITTWFYDYLPTTTNKPASDWKTDEEKITHEGDLFYCTDSNNARAYRYVYNDSTKQHEWLLIEDTDVTKALADAAKAQDTADNKRRVFVVEPKPPYDIGDLWVQGSSGDIMKCKTPRSEGDESYKIDTDWEKASKYTDDSAWKSWTSDTGEFGKYKTEIKKQIDGKSNCTYGGSTPPSNPETGDLWFCTDGSGGYGANKAYMYNGTSWKESNGVPDSVWDIADGKSSIFVVKPENPLSDVDSHCYYKGDIWILESNMTLNDKEYKEGSIMTATVDSTKFNSSHWVEKVRYTDDTKADEVEESLKAYKEETGLFQNKVTNALGVDEVILGTDGCVIAPRLGGGYLYIKDARKENNTGLSVEINPTGVEVYDANTGESATNHKDNYVFNISKDSSVIMGVTTDGDGYFSGEINATSGYIGGKTGWTIDGTTIINKSGDAVIQTGDGSTFTKITQGCIYTSGRVNSEAPWQKVNLQKGIIFCERPYSDCKTSIDSYGIQQLGTNGEVWLDTNTDTDTIILGQNSTTIGMKGNTIFHNSATFNNTTRYNSALRLYASSTSNDYSELSCTALSSSGADAYFLVKSSMAIGYRLQVGNVDSFDNNHTFRVDGTSYVTGTSYTNSGTTVTSDKNKKNSISSPSDNYVALFDSLEFKKFKYNDGTSDRFHLGVIAQEVEEAMNSVGLSTKDFGGLVIDKNNNYFVRYDEINTLTALKVKQLESRIKKLEEELNNTQSNVK